MVVEARILSTQTNDFLTSFLLGFKLVTLLGRSGIQPTFIRWWNNFTISARHLKLNNLKKLQKPKNKIVNTKITTQRYYTIINFSSTFLTNLDEQSVFKSLSDILYIYLNSRMENFDPSQIRTYNSWSSLRTDMV